MKKTTFSLFITLLFMQWYSILVESADESVATVTGAAIKSDNQYMTLIQDDEIKSGWAIEVKKAISKKISTDNLFLFFYTTDSEGNVKFSFAAQLCHLLQNGDKPSQFLYKQITDMIFRKQNGSCEFKTTVRPIGSKAPVNTTPSDSNPGDFMPKSTPFEVEARLLTYKQANQPDDGDYLFKVNLKVDKK